MLDNSTPVVMSSLFGPPIFGPPLPACATREDGEDGEGGISENKSSATLVISGQVVSWSKIKNLMSVENGQEIEA